MSQNIVVRESDLERRRKLGEQTRNILVKLLNNFEHLYYSDDVKEEDSSSYNGEKSETILGVENGDEKYSSSPGSKESKAVDVLTCLDQLDICAKQIKSHSDTIIRFLSTQMDIPVPRIALN
ncbi:uncharacterized protein [Anabrus simplex]|uniref:uncharacterized protein n=1 Tax=Anabrus simplex TaxID=316456 RepID=UPI0034DD19BD